MRAPLNPHSHLGAIRESRVGSLDFHFFLAGMRVTAMMEVETLGENGLLLWLPPRGNKARVPIHAEWYQGQLSGKPRRAALFSDGKPPTPPAGSVEAV